MAGNHPNVDGVRFATLARFPGYCFGDDGSIWSSRVKGHAGKRGPWKQLKARFDTKGYRHVTLIDSGGTAVHQAASRLTLEAFHGPAPTAGSTASHLDNDPSNGRLDNLAWRTLQTARLPTASPEIVQAIRAEYAADARWGRLTRLANKYGMTPSQIRRIATQDRTS